MNKKIRYRIRLFFQVTGTISFCLLIGKMGDLQLDKITVGQAIVHSIIAILYMVIAYATYRILGSANDD